MPTTSINWHHIIASTIGAVLIVIATNIFMYAYLRANPVNEGLSRVYDKWAYLNALETGADWILLGDSSCTTGLQPALMEKRLGASVINLCTIADTGLTHDAWMLQYYIKRFGAPKGVIVARVFHEWDRTRDDLRPLVDDIPLPREEWGNFIPQMEFSWQWKLYQKFRPFTVLYDKSLSVAFLMRKIFKVANRSEKRRDSLEQRLSFIVRNKGFVPEARANPDRVRAEAQALLKQHSGKPFYISPDNVDALKTMASLADKKSFAFYIMNSNVPDVIVKDDGMLAFYADMALVMQRLISANGKGRFIGQNPPAFAAEEMENIDHVIGKKAVKKFSNAVVDEVLGNPVR